MSAIEDFLEQVKSTVSRVWDDLQEQSWFLSIKEKYDDLPASSQRGLVIGITSIIGLGLISIPYGNYSTSSDFIEQFEADRSLNIDFLKAKSMQVRATFPIEKSDNMLKKEISNFLESVGISEDKQASIESATQVTSLSPKKAKTVAVEVSLTQLNLKQIVDLGSRLSTMPIGSKLTTTQITRSADNDHLYDIRFVVHHMYVAAIDFSGPVKKKNSPRNAKKRSRSRG